jgi:hypothetical protein
VERAQAVPAGVLALRLLGSDGRGEGALSALAAALTRTSVQASERLLRISEWMGLCSQALAAFAVLAAATVDGASVGAPMRLRGGAPKKAGPPTRADWIKKAESMKVSEGAHTFLPMCVGPAHASLMSAVCC